MPVAPPPIMATRPPWLLLGVLLLFGPFGDFGSFGAFGAFVVLGAFDDFALFGPLDDFNTRPCNNVSDDASAHVKSKATRAR